MKRLGILIAFFSLSVISCNDFINIDSPTVVRQDLYFKSTADFTAAVNGAYSGLRGYYAGFYEAAEIPSDNAQATGYTLTSAPMDQLNWLPSTGAIQSRWSLSYSVIARCNTILSRIENFEMDNALKTQYQGEVRFIRALMYFNLVQFFGNVPLVVNEIVSEGEAYEYTRTPVAEIYSQIERDLISAAENLPEQHTSTNTGRVTKGAALSLLGKVYTTNRQFDKAVDALQRVVNPGVYRLLANYESVFSVDNKNNEEIVFAVQYLGGTGRGEGSNFSISFAPFGSGTSVTSGGTPASANAGTLDLYNAFEEGDLRKSVAIALWPEGGLFYTRKFLDKPAASNEGKNDWPVIRYPDVLLLLAEAYNETGQPDKSLLLLGEVRTRAGLSPISTTDQGELRDAIQRERRVELCFEGHRWFDLLRTGTMLSTMRAYKEKYHESGGYLVVNYEVTDNKVLFPVPFREMSLNPELGQNQGY